MFHSLTRGANLRVSLSLTNQHSRSAPQHGALFVLPSTILYLRSRNASSAPTLCAKPCRVFFSCSKSLTDLSLCAWNKLSRYTKRSFKGTLEGSHVVAASAFFALNTLMHIDATAAALNALLLLADAAAAALFAIEAVSRIKQT